MRKLTLMLLFLALLGLVPAGNAWGQDLKLPQPSPVASIAQTVGLTDITITYCRPGVKGRDIWGGLVAYDKVWRTGANAATTIEFSTAVKIGGTDVPKGKYAIFTIPGKDKWTVIISKQTSLWGSDGYKQDEDVARVEVKSETADFCERMKFDFAELKNDSVHVVLRWEKVKIAFAVTMDTHSMVMKSIDRAMGRHWRAPYSAAGYAVEKGMMKEARAWIDQSTAIKAVFWNMRTRARIYKQMAKTKKEVKEAIKVMEDAIKLGADLPANLQGYVESTKKQLDEWKAKK